MKITAVIVVAVIVLGLAGVLRVGGLDEDCWLAGVSDRFAVPALDNRPLHGDEAVNTFKFRELYEDNAYRYDPTEYHGPTLPYATLVAAWLCPERDFREMDIGMYRAVTVAFGLGLVVMTVLLGWAIGWPAALVAGALVAISPPMVFYSRYYIHEIPLVFFTAVALLAAWRYAVTGRLAWAAALGAGLGLMHATKETAAIAWFAAAVATAVMFAVHYRQQLTEGVRGLVRRHAAAGGVAIGVWAVLAVVLFSSFFTYAWGPVDSVLTYVSYLDRGTGGEPLHVQPWHYYLELLAWYRPVEPLIWTELLTLSLAGVGVIAAALGTGMPARSVTFVRWLAIYTLVMIAVFSVIPYKTPWNVLIFLHGMMLLAGVGAVAVAWALPRWLASKVAGERAGWREAVAWPLTLIVAAPIGWGAWQLLEQTERATGRFNADRRNPWVYAHSSAGVSEIGRRLEEIAQLHPQGRQMPVRIYDDGNVWPVPWYLRRLEQVGYFPHLPEEELSGPVVLIEARLDEEAQLWDRLDETHAGPRYTGIRSDHRYAMYVEQELWEAYLESRR